MFNIGDKVMVNASAEYGPGFRYLSESKVYTIKRIHNDVVKFEEIPMHIFDTRRLKHVTDFDMEE
jgi:hypothetical protein